MGIYTVTELNNHIKHTLTSDPVLDQIWVQGEISNLTKHRSGHYYFTIKDENSQISCVSFRSVNRTLRFEPETNMKVLVFGSIDVYTVRGIYQLRVLDLRPDGVGELYKAYEQLKTRLAKEGLFDGSHKRVIPGYPRRIGVATSPTGAAIHDILNVITRRFPADILLAPTIVQGERSAQSIEHAIDILNHAKVDVIIVGRGGGSLEDLWSFNEENVARAIFRSSVPIISAVGHETDFTIADFTADRRAPTPSAAAELAVPDLVEVMRHIDSLSARMEQALTHDLSEKKMHLQHLNKVIGPERFRDVLLQNYQHIDEIISRIIHLMEAIMNTKRSSLKVCSGRLHAISPLRTIERGYSIAVRSTDGRTIRSVDDINEGEILNLTVMDGSIECNVMGKSRGTMTRDMTGEV
ncbi:MAG: exodeoxyribonuclease VII large subunit [Euryarchaeota archaeon]|nr:exodeoxyribonuclease VII large subunit [Euryarchaeota archaeon]